MPKRATVAAAAHGASPRNPPRVKRHKRQERRAEKESPWTLAPPETAYALARALRGGAKGGAVVGLNAATRLVERGGAAAVAVCDDAVPRAILDNLVSAARARGAPVCVLPRGGSAVLAAAVGARRCLAVAAIAAADETEALEDFRAAVYRDATEPTAASAAASARRAGAFDAARPPARPG